MAVVSPGESVIEEHCAGQQLVLQQQVQIIQQMAAPIIAPIKRAISNMVVLFFMVVVFQGETNRI
jgi:hypothetical protein